MPVGPDGWFEASKPIAVDGIKARSQRGRIGARWWSRRFTDLLESICDGGRLTRGRAYARKGQVLYLSVAPGVVTALVQGSRPDPYQATVRIPVFDSDAWAAVYAALRSQARFRALLLAGEMPPEIVDVFAAAGHPLFPDRLDLDCACPDWGSPCKHLSAALYLLAEAFDDDPFLVLAWRGRDRQELLDALRSPTVLPTGDARAESDDADDGAPLTPADWYSCGMSLAELRERVAVPATGTPELLLRSLAPPPVTVRHIPLVDVLRAPYRRLADNAES
ncbi:hypothetical protein [Pilimelia columellifera]|uniref:SWIM zinc finger family protein n=1 Tax=Pilimelia columellifera subsp. columellifera TaxID=706583 RepID=A0ABN3N1Q4_9ACTN